MRTVKVPLGDRSYSIKIGNSILSRLGSECRRLKLGTRCAVITDRKVGPIYSKAAMSSLREAGFEPVEIRVPAGETAKSLDTIHSCYDKLARHRLERSSFIVALGGGVVGDMAGFLAASYLR
ncbi:MAG TPA: 3-dehydroquinate synthase, partial [Verrucomicrobiales bacterium]|nr:3-dehydroquinate synthase [Verrucomicrobiales bacterium]